MRLPTWLLVLACNEYGIHGESDPESDAKPDDTDLVSDTDRDCVAEHLPGMSAGYNAECAPGDGGVPLAPVLEWSTETYDLLPQYDTFAGMPVVASINDDNGDGLIDEADVPDILLVSYDWRHLELGGALRAVSGDGSGDIWAVDGLALQTTSGVAAGDIDGDGAVEIVALTQGGVVAVEHDGTMKWTLDGLEDHMFGSRDQPSISDMNHDGSPEILVGNAIINADGTLHAAGARGMGGSDTFALQRGTCSFAVDLDGDGLEDLVTGNTAYRYDGSVLWESGLADGYPAVGDFVSDSAPEVVVSTGGSLLLIDADGALIWSVDIPGAESWYDQGPNSGPPTVADFDGDGEPEIGVSSSTAYTVFEADGSIAWQRPIEHNDYGNAGSTVFDFEGDGIAEVVHADLWHLWVFDGRDGSVRLEEYSAGTAGMVYPVVADVDGDGQAEILVKGLSSSGATSIRVYGADAWAPARKIWNQHAYFSTNVEADGGIPVVAEQNWLTLNTFRGVSPGEPSYTADLVVAEGVVCETDCAEGRILVEVHPGNQGALGLPVGARARLTLYLWQRGVPNLVQTADIATDLPSGAYAESVTLQATGFTGPIERFTVDISAEAPECDPLNDTLVIPGPFCE